MRGNAYLGDTAMNDPMNTFMNSRVKPYGYFLVLAIGCWTSCKKHDSVSRTVLPPKDQKEYLAKIVSTTQQDSVVYLYTDTVLRGFAAEYQFNGTPVISAYFPAYSDGLLTALGLGLDTSGNNVAPAYIFSSDANNRVVLVVNNGGNLAYYDSLGYNNAGQISVVYHNQGTPQGSHSLTSVSTLSWDAYGDVTQLLTGDSLNNIASSYSYKGTYNYDNNPNPLVQIKANFLTSVVQENYFQYLSAHNITGALIIHQDINSLQQVTETATYVYSYDTAGNPTSMTYSDTENGVTSTSNQLFTYVLK